MDAVDAAVAVAVGTLLVMKEVRFRHAQTTCCIVGTATISNLGHAPLLNMKMHHQH